MKRQLVQLRPGQLTHGAPLPFDVLDEHGTLLAAKGQSIPSEARLEALLERGIYAEPAAIEALANGPAAPLQPERVTLFQLWEQAPVRLDRLLKSIDPEPGFPARCEQFANQLMALARRDVDIAIYLSVRQDPSHLHQYGLNHSIHCALACQLMTERMGWPSGRIGSLIKAALTMNLSIIDVQGRYASHGRLTEEQRDRIEEHPDQANERLRAAGVDDESWLQTVLEHHERPGGNGYPRGLARPSEAAEVLRMADVFTAKISPRAERPALSIQDAARQMYGEAKGNPAAAAMIKEYGIYPPGNFVYLRSGELAVVIRRGATAHTPLVAAITNESGVPTINTTRRDTALAPFAIKSLAPDSPMLLRVPAERLYGLVE